MPSPSMFRRATLALAVAILAGGCADDATGPDGPVPAAVASVTLDTVSLLLAAGETWQLVATPRDASGAPVTGVPVDWSVTGDIGAAQVSATGLVTARTMGVATIHAAAGGKLAQVRLRVAGTPAHDLVFARFVTVDEDGNESPRIHLLDLRSTGVAPASLFDAGYARQVAPSPDGARVAFVCFHGGAAICTANRDGTDLRVLGFSAIGGLRGDQPAWSPDGTQIAFRGWVPGATNGAHNPADIWVMNAADGSGKVRLTSGVAGVDDYESPAWSPRQRDGSYRLALSHAVIDAGTGVRAAIETMRADGSDRHAITAGGFVDVEPTWSPQGDAIAFVRTGSSTAGDIWVTGDFPGMARPLMSSAVDPAGAQRAPAWSPDGDMIAFTSRHEAIGTDQAWRVYTVRADGTALVRRTGDAGDAESPAWIRRP